jgi:aspartate carbamoyltransferase catalytic subunit
MPDYITAPLDCHSKSDSIESVIGELDVLYMTRIQRERFASPEEYARQKQVFTLDVPKLKSAKADLIIMHPLPRVDEITTQVDDDPRAVYFKQANYGMYVRMALILSVLNHDMDMKPLTVGKAESRECKNLKCVTNYEETLPRRYVGKVCEYCDSCN